MGVKQNTPVWAVIWSFIERLSTEIATFAIGVFLARLLSPRDYGIVGMTGIFIAISAVFVEGGFANALIRKLDRTEKDLATAFYFNVGFGLFCYALLWFTAPLIANYFNESILVPVIRIVSLTIVFSSLCIVQSAILTANLNIKAEAIISLFSQAPAGIVAIYLAYNQYGVYALAIQTVLSTFIRVILFWCVVKWRPKERFSIESFKYLWGFGSKLVGATLIGTVFSQIYSVLIGKYIGKTDLGYFSKARSLSGHVTTISTGVMYKVAVPLLSRKQSSVDELRNAFRDVMRLLVILTAPIAAFCVYEASDIITFLWTDKWAQSISMFQLIVIGLVWEPISQLSLSMLQVVNKTGLILKLEFPKKASYLIIIIIGFQFGIYGLLFGMIAINVVGALINLYPTKRILNYSYVRQLIDILKYIVIAFAVGAVLKLVKIFDYTIFNIILNGILYSFLYLLTLFIMRDAVFLKYCKKLVLSKINK